MSNITCGIRTFLRILPAALALIAAPAGAAPDCSALTVQPIYQSVNPSTRASLLTPWQSEVLSAKEKHGFTEDRGTIFHASVVPAQGLSPVYRLYNPATGGFLWTISSSERDSAVKTYGFVDNGINFYASTTPGDCTQPVYRYRSGTMHRHVVTQADRDALTAQGWVHEGTVSFFAGTPPGKTLFSIAILPDTQQEVQVIWQGNPRPLNDLRFKQRMQWLAANKASLDLRYVLHIGDVTSWGERDAHQYEVAADAFRVLKTANIPFIASVGNHDTRAVCDGGSACPGQDTRKALRELPLFNQYFEPLMGSEVKGRYQAGNLSNVYSLFEAGGVKWLVLSLELWPRYQTPSPCPSVVDANALITTPACPSVIDWAKRVVAAYPRHNVIVSTHSFLTSGGAILGNFNGNYGEATPQYLYDNLIKLYPNVRFVFSGHEGNALSRPYTGVNGNKIVASLQSFHSNTTNPVRIMEIDTAKDTVRTYIVAPKTNETWTQYDYQATGMGYIH